MTDLTARADGETGATAQPGDLQHPPGQPAQDQAAQDQAAGTTRVQPAQDQAAQDQAAGTTRVQPAQDQVPGTAGVQPAQGQVAGAGRGRGARGWLNGGEVARGARGWLNGGEVERGVGVRWGLLLGVVGGLALTGAFPPYGVWPLAAVGPALLAVALRGQRAWTSLAIGGLFGLAFFFPLLSWVVNLAWYAWVALAVSETAIFAVVGLGQRLLLRLRAWPVAVAGWWVAAEAFRDRWPWGGFPWGRLAMSQAQAPTLRWVSVGGPPLLSFLVALAGGTLAWLIVERKVVPAVSFACVAGVALAGAALPAGTAGRTSATVAAIQGDVPRARNLVALLNDTDVTDNHAIATEKLAAAVKAGRRPAPELVIWPENSTDLDPFHYPSIYQTISDAVQSINRPVLVGEFLDDPGQKVVRNVGQLWLPGRGPTISYAKRQLVPFGEYIPLRGLLSHITSLTTLQPVNLTPGGKTVVFHVGQIRLGDVICYEVGFDGLVRSEVTGGANLLSVQTNDATFEVDGQIGESLQQLAMARVRAVEFDRSVVVASTTGVSALVAPDGHLIAHTGIWQQAVLDARVPLLTGRTLAYRVAGWPEYVITGLTVLALAAAATGAIGDRRRKQPASAGRT
jgi:apolipoprotein N-acyltransferase